MHSTGVKNNLTGLVRCGGTAVCDFERVSSLTTQCSFGCVDIGAAFKCSVVLILCAIFIMKLDNA